MLPVNNLINQLFFGSYQWDIYNQRFSSSIPVDRVTGAGQTQIGYWSDSQLWQTIAWSRFAYERNPVVKGIINILIDHIGKPHVEWVGDKKLVKRVTRLWEKFSRVNCLGDAGYLTTGELSQDREKEIRVRWLRDGEVFIRFFVKDEGYPLVLRFVEPEQVRTPPIDRDEKFSHTWGIVTEIDDNENIRGYWVYYPNQGEWDYVHRRYMVYGRRNADRNVKRGLPEIANLELDFAHLWQLLRGVTITSKAQASIAWIEKYPGAMLEQILAHSISTKDTGTTSFGPFKPGAPNLSPSFYGVDPNAKAIDPGTILSVNQGKEYEPGPTSDPQKYIDACASILHLLSLQWCLPDWITKGPEAYASALVSGSPFVRRIESMQADYAAIFGQVCTTFVRLAERLGWLERKTLQKVQPVVRLPSVIMADEIKQVETLQSELQSGLLSEIEYLHKRGRDPRKTLAQRRKWRELLSKYGVDDQKQGVSEDKEKNKTKKVRDYLNPPGSRILREEECEKQDFLVTRRLTGKCETVSRCKDWVPGDKSPYVMGCEHSHWDPDSVSTGLKPSEKVAAKVNPYAIKAFSAMENMHRIVSKYDIPHNEKQEIMGNITEISSSIIACGYLKELSSYPEDVKRWVIRKLVMQVKGNDKVARLFPDVTGRTEKDIEAKLATKSNDELNDLIEKAAEIVQDEVSEVVEKYKDSEKAEQEYKEKEREYQAKKAQQKDKKSKKGQQDQQDQQGQQNQQDNQEQQGSKKDSKDKKKSAATPILDILAQMAIDNLENSIGKGEKIALPESTPNKQEIEYAMSRMNFTPNDIVSFLGGAMTMGSIEHQIQEHHKVMLRSSVLKTLAGKIPYLQNVKVSDSLSEFAFESFVAVNEKTYSKIISEMDRVLKRDTTEDELSNLLRDVVRECPNIHGSLGEKEKKTEDNQRANRIVDSVMKIEDKEKRKQVIQAMLLRCIFSYGTAEIARRGNEEAWAKTHGAGMAYNPQFPGIDNVMTMSKDGKYYIIPMSHKMHMTEGSNDPDKEFGHMSKIKELIKQYHDSISTEVQKDISEVLASESGERQASLNTKIQDLENSLRANNCDKVDWNKASGNRDNCFKLDYKRMILLSLSKHIDEMPKDGHEKIVYTPITLVRFRAERIEFHHGVEVEDGGKIKFISRPAGTYKKTNYETREDMIKNAMGSYEVGEMSWIVSNTSQVQQPQAK
jgi:hypothetical protein